MKARSFDVLRWTSEIILAAAAGTAALAFQVLTGQAPQGHSAAFMPFMADVVEGVQSDNNEMKLTKPAKARMARSSQLISVLAS